MSVIESTKNPGFAVTTYEQLNTSNAKQKYSFSKALRFKKMLDDGTPMAYTLPSQLAKRGTGIGFGSKMDPTKTSFVTPPPNTYTLKSVFDSTDVLSNKSRNRSERKKTHCFGAGREHFERTHNPANLKPDPIVPGPGTYSDSTRNIAVQARKFSLNFRTLFEDATSQAMRKAVPSPATYGDVAKMGSKG